MKDFKKILIIGDAGRGKTTFAEKLSKKLNIPKYSLDDFYWEVKFTKPRDKEESLNLAKECFKKTSWIVEGGTRRMIEVALDDSDVIFYLTHNNIFTQAFILFKRNLSRENENLKNLWDLLVYQFKKKHKIGKHKDIKSFEEMIGPHKEKVVNLNSFRKINKLLNN